MKALHFYALILLLFSGHKCYAKVIVEDKENYAVLDGSADFRFGYIKDNEDRFGNDKKNIVSFGSDIHFLYSRNVGQDNSGANIKLSAKFVSNKSDVLDINASDAYLFFKTKNRGAVELGFGSTVGKTMGINTSNIYIATGGVNGSWADFANLRGFNKAGDGPGYDTSGLFWVKPGLYSDYKGLKTAPLVSYYSPKVSGVQMGFSYVPGNSEIDYQNIAIGAITYSNRAFRKVDYSLSLSGELANENRDKKLNKLQAWNTGLNLKYENLSYVFSCGNIGKSGQRNSPETYYINTGVAYYHDGWRGGLTYFTSTRGDNDLSSWSVNWEKFFTKNASYYIDFTGFNTKEPADSSNSGYVLLTGLKSSF